MNNQNHWNKIISDDFSPAKLAGNVLVVLIDMANNVLISKIVSAELNFLLVQIFSLFVQFLQASRLYLAWPIGYRMRALRLPQELQLAQYYFDVENFKNFNNFKNKNHSNI